MGDKEVDILQETCDGDTPTRYEILSMVRKYSNLLSESTSTEQDASDTEMDERFWQEVLDMYFVRGTVPNERLEDDLIFFVGHMGLDRNDYKDDLEREVPFFVRRWAPKLENVIGDDLVHVDWRRSFYLNFVAHTSYSVTVAICSNQALRRYQNGEYTSLSPVYKVVKTVYASPSRVNFQLDLKKAVETVPAYPNICFAIDDSDDTINAVVLSEEDHCYCVLLNAHGGAAFPEVSSLPTTHFYGSSGVGIFEKNKLPKLTLFSGFVSYQMVREAYEDGKSTFGNIFSFGNASSKTDRLFMRGPGGRGEVEVIVTGIADQGHHILAPHKPLQISKRISGLGKFVKAASAAYTATASATKPDKELLPLKCCLMSISLPWDSIAHDLLFKTRPPVNI